MLFVLSLGAELVANDQPIAVQYDGGWYFPAFKSYPETTFGGDLEFDADYSDPYITDLIKEKGKLYWPLIRGPNGHLGACHRFKDQSLCIQLRLR